MFSQFITLLCFSSSLAHDWTTGLFLNDQPDMVRPFLIDMNPVELKYLPFMISLDKFSGIVVYYLQKICYKRNKRHTC